MLGRKFILTKTDVDAWRLLLFLKIIAVDVDGSHAVRSRRTVTKPRAIIVTFFVLVVLFLRFKGIVLALKCAVSLFSIEVVSMLPLIIEEGGVFHERRGMGVTTLLPGVVPAGEWLWLFTLTCWFRGPVLGVDQVKVLLVHRWELLDSI